MSATMAANGRRIGGGTAEALVRENWPEPVPAWVLLIAVAIDRRAGSLHNRQRMIAAQIGYSNAVIHEVLRNKYRGNAENIASAARRHLESETADCPILGQIAHEDCVTHQRAKFHAANPQMVRLWRACRAGCAYSAIDDKGDIAC